MKVMGDEASQVVAGESTFLSFTFGSYKHTSISRKLHRCLMFSLFLNYSGEDKTSVESLGGDFSINNAFNPRNLGAK